MKAPKANKPFWKNGNLILVNILGCHSWMEQSVFLCAPIKVDAADGYELVKPNAPDRPKVSVLIPVPRKNETALPEPNPDSHQSFPNRKSKIENGMICRLPTN